MAPAVRIAPVQAVRFSVMSDAYGTFITTLRTALAGPGAEMVGPTPNVQRPVLAKQTGDNAQPPRWIRVELVGKNGAAPKVAVRSDNAYIMGFTNSQGTWFQLSKTGTKEKLVDDKAVMVGFDGHYQTLVGGVNNLTTLDLTKFSTATAAGKLWNYKKKAVANDDLEEDAELSAGADDEVKTALATLCVVLSEAARLAPVYNVVNGGWSKNVKVSITKNEVGYIRDWSDVSTALLAWKKAGYKNDATIFKAFSGIGISNGQQALAVVQIVLQVKRGLLAWLSYCWALLVKMLQLQPEDNTVHEKKKQPTKQLTSSATVNPL